MGGVKGSLQKKKKKKNPKVTFNKCYSHLQSLIYNEAKEA